jgi:hypothetical protein
MYMYARFAGKQKNQTHEEIKHALQNTQNSAYGRCVQTYLTILLYNMDGL